MVETQFNLQKCQISDLKQQRITCLTPNRHHYHQEWLQDKTNESSCALVHFQIGPITPRVNLINSILMDYLKVPFSADLRTKQQLGYSVNSSRTVVNNILGNRFAVVSPKRCCAFLCSRIDNFLLERKSMLEDGEFTDEIFEQHRNAVLTNLEEKDISLAAQADRNWEEVTKHTYNFNKQESDCQIIRTITKAEVMDHFQKTFFSSSTKRLDIHFISSKHVKEQAESIVHSSATEFNSMPREEVKDIAAF